MAKLYIREYQRIGKGFNGHQIPAGEEPGTDQLAVAIGGGSLQSAAFADSTAFVGLTTDAICSVVFGTNPTATTNGWRMGAGATQFFAVSPGSAMKVAVISNT